MCIQSTNDAGMISTSVDSLVHFFRICTHFSIYFNSYTTHKSNVIHPTIIAMMLMSPWIQTLYWRVFIHLLVCHLYTNVCSNNDKEIYFSNILFGILELVISWKTISMTDPALKNRHTFCPKCTWYHETGDCTRVIPTLSHWVGIRHPAQWLDSLAGKYRKHI